MTRIILISILISSSVFAAQGLIRTTGKAIEGVVDAGGNAVNTKIGGSVKMKSDTKVQSISVSGDDNDITVGKNKINRGAKVGGSVDMTSKTKINSLKATGDDNSINIGGNEM